MNPTPTKLEQVKTWGKIFSEGTDVLGTSSSFPEASQTTKLGDNIAVSPPVFSHIENILHIFGPFHKVSLQTVQMIIMMEIEHSLRPTLTFSVSSTTALLSTKCGQQSVGQCIAYKPSDYKSIHFSNPNGFNVLRIQKNWLYHSSTFRGVHVLFPKF